MTQCSPGSTNHYFPRYQLGNFYCYPTHFGLEPILYFGCFVLAAVLRLAVLAVLLRGPQLGLAPSWDSTAVLSPCLQAWDRN